NQSGIGRGYYSEENFTALTDWMIDEFEKKALKIEKVYYCPHTPEDKCHCRKPATGMIEQALADYPVNLANSWLIGDKQSDIDLALNAEIGNSIYIGNKDITNATYTFNSIPECRVGLPTI
ncbi:MAG: HAD-IIIA family hydrolase, partial [Sulfurovum sp.]|nr:HAD-IIIA family hydrolase [Sulfurovum sp.]